MKTTKQSVIFTTTVGAAERTGGLDITGLQIPVGWAGTSITFKVGHTSSELKTLKDASGTAVSVTVAADTSVALPVGFCRGWNCVQLIASASNSAKAVVLITADPTRG